MTNVLLTCAGRRNYLVHYFRSALGPQGSVFAADASENAPAMAEADQAFVVPSVHDPRYLDVVLEICREHDVHMIVSLNDLELPVLARARNRSLDHGIVPVVSSPHVIDTCFDKVKTATFLESIGVGTPATYSTLESAKEAIHDGVLQYPVVLKPRWGTASIGITFASDQEELALGYRLLQRQLQRTILANVSQTDLMHSIVIQERLQGDEFGLDVVNDLQGQYVATCARQKLSMRAGETDRAVTVVDDRLDRLGSTMGRALGHVGNLDCDVFIGPRGVFVLEMNPRFGGGYPFSHAAGVNLPAALLAWASGKPSRAEWLSLTPGVIAAKCDHVVVTRSAMLV
jgi:carbamoyl-phosphate synthase large subunit